MSCGRFGPGQARFNGGEVQFDTAGEFRIGRRVGAEEPLVLGVSLHEVDRLLAAAGAMEVAQRLVVDREEADGGAVLGRHVGDGGAIRQPEGGQAGSVVFDELVHHALGAEHLRDAEDEVGGGGARGQRTGQLHPDHIRHQHEIGLAQHDSFRLDSADAPADDAQSVDHRGVGVGPDEGVGVGRQQSVLLAELDGGGEMLQVDLVDDAHARRHHAEVVEGALRELEELVALGIPVEFERDVEAEGVGGPVVIHLDRVVDDQVAGDDRIDPVGVSAHLGHGIAHGREIHDAGHTGEVLEDHPRRHEGEFRAVGLRRLPSGERLDMLLRGHPLTAPPEGVLQQHTHREGEAVEVADPLPGELGEAIDRNRLGSARECAAGAEGIGLGGGHECVRTVQFIEGAK